MPLEFRFWFSSLECHSSSFHCKERTRPSGSTFRASWPSMSRTRGPRRPGSRRPRCQLVRRQVRAIRVYRVSFLGVDARGFPGRRPHARTPSPYLTGLFEAVIRRGTTGVVALAYPRRVRGCIMRRVRLPYPYVPHLCCLLSSWPYPTPSAGETLAFSPNGLGALSQLLKESPYL